MIEAIYLLGIAAVVVINITALTLIVMHLVPFPAIARVTGLIAVCLALFSLEHFVGLGELYALSMPLTALSLGVIWLEWNRFRDETYRSSEIVFLSALLYAAVWKVAFPEIVEDNDRLADLHLVANYLNGDRLAAADAWLPDQKLDYYYAFQLDGTGYYAQDPANARMLRLLTEAPRGVVLEKIHDTYPIDTGIYGSFAVKPSVVGIPWAIVSWRKDMTELKGLMADVNSFYAGSHDQPALPRRSQCQLCGVVGPRRR